MQLDRLEQVRKSKKLTRDELAEKSGVPKITIYSLEKGVVSAENVKLSTLVKLARALRVSITRIIPIEYVGRLK